MTPTSTRYFIATLIAASTACVEEPPDPDALGEIALALRVAESTGGEWWIDGGVFTISQFGQSVEEIDDIFFQKAIRRRLPAGDYAVELGGDWGIARRVGDDTYSVPGVELVTQGAIGFTVTAGKPTQVTFEFRRRPEGNLAIGMELDSTTHLAGSFSFERVDEATPWLAPLLGQQVTFAWSFDETSVWRGGAGTSDPAMWIVGVEDELSFAVGTPDLMLELFAGYDGDDDPAASLHVLPDGKVNLHVGHVWTHDDPAAECELRIVALDTQAPLDEEGLPVLIAIDAEDAEVQIVCVHDDDQASAVYGTASFTFE